MSDPLERSKQALLEYYNEAIPRLPSDIPDLNLAITTGTLSTLLERLFTFEGRAHARGDQRFPFKTSQTLRHLAGETLLHLEDSRRRQDMELVRRVCDGHDRDTLPLN